MLLLTFSVDACRYAIDVARVVEVVPRVALRPIPHAPPYLAGLFNLGGELVPAVDLGVRLGGEPCRPRLSTRIIIASDSAGRRLGLIAERVTELITAPDDLFTARHAGPPREAPYLGPIVTIDDAMIQLIRIDDILPDALREDLYGRMLGRV